MRFFLLAFVTISCMSPLGCGSGGTVVVKGPNMRDFHSELEQALTDARGTLTSIQSAIANPQPRSEEDEPGEEEKPEMLIRGAIQSVASAAQQLAQSAVGHAAESDAKAIQADAQALLQKAEGAANPAEMLNGLQQISDKAEAIKSKL